MQPWCSNIMIYDDCQKSNFHSMETGRIKPHVHATMKGNYSVVHRQMDVVPPEQILCLLTSNSVIKQWCILFAELNGRMGLNMMWQKTKFYYKKKLKLKLYYTDQL